MEDGAKDPVQWKDTSFLGKAGWVKKAPGRLLASYKDRYIHVEKTEVVVYENEDLQNCLERLDLEKYDKCHELRSPFKKKHRLILIRSPKSGNKINDVKFQAQTIEEKEAWIKALSDGINRAKNKVFDEVKIDESCNLEHVTRTRPKGNRNRRPPTRIHMKEVAIMSSDGILRLDLDNALISTGTHEASVDGTETPKGAIHVPTAPTIASEATQKQLGQCAEEEAQNEPEVSTQKKVIKPPMPPTKEAKYSVTPEGEPDKDDGPMKKVPKLPIPPSKESKPCVSSAEETRENNKGREMPEKSPDSRKKTGPPPPTPPSKPSSISNLADVSQSRPNSHPPTPPSNEKKPSHSTIEPGQEVQGTNDKIKEALPSVTFDKPERPSIEGQVSEEKSGETISNGLNKLSHTEKRQDPTALLQITSDSSTSFPQEQEVLFKRVSSVLVSLNDQYPDNLSQSPVLCLLHGEKKKEEEKSLDSSQHSDDDSEDSLAAPTAALRENHAVLNKVDTSVDDIQISVHLRQPQAPLRSQVKSEGFPSQCSKLNSLLKTSAKARSASIGDLLYDSSVCTQVTQHTRSATGNDRVPSDDFMKFEAKVSLEMEKTSELLNKVTQYEKVHDEEGTPEILLAKAMEKLRKAEHVLREVKKLKPAKNSSNRKSW